MTKNGMPAELRALLSQERIVIAPGVFDGITARFAEQAGFPCLYMTGAGTSLSLGYPDLGLLTMTEMVDKVRLLTRTAGVPVIADADTGYGNEMNVTRTVQEYQQAGAAGLHIEDQVSPKRCGHLDGKELVSSEEFVAKIRAAVAARTNPDFLVIARTDARAVAGLEEAVSRANAALRAGGRHGVRRSNPNPGGTGIRAAPGERPLPAERGAGRQDAGYQFVGCPGDGLSLGYPAKPAAGRRDGCLRCGAGRIEGHQPGS